MIKIFLHFIVFLSFLPAFADQPDKKPQAVLPVQEKVYLHFDNNCYFLGDTIWYKAYVVLADDNSPQPLSKILYVELLNEQGYILELACWQYGQQEAFWPRATSRATQLHPYRLLR